MTTADPNSSPVVIACHCCGMAQVVPAVSGRRRACCVRCSATLDHAAARVSSNSRTAAIAFSALVLYPFAIHLPMLRIEQLGHQNEASIFDGTATLLAEGHLFVGIIVLLCSIVLPVVKLVGLLVLSAGNLFLREPHHRAWTYRFIEWTGRWGMLDVLAVAVLVAVVKLRTSVDLTAGPGAAAFCVVVVLSLLASATFDPHSMWEGVNMRDAGRASKARKQRIPN